MSIAYPAILNQIIYHNLAHPFGGVVEIDNTSPFYVYVSISPRASVADILSENVALVAPYGKRAFKVTITNQAPIISIAPTNQPYQFTGTIRNSQALIRISEYSDPKAFLNSPTFEGLAADYLIIANGLIEANQQGIYTRDSAGNEVMAINIEPGKSWAGRTLGEGDVMIGRGTNFVLWDNAAGSLNVAGSFTVLGGSGVYPIYTSVVFSVEGPDTFSWSAGEIGLSNGQRLSIPAGYASPYPNREWVAVARDGAGGLYVTDAPEEIINDGHLAIAVFEPGSVAGSISVFMAGTLISGDRIVTGSIVTTNLAATAIDGMLITGATIRTNAASIPDVKIDADGVQILADGASKIQWVRSNSDIVGSLDANSAGGGVIRLVAGNSLTSGTASLVGRASGSAIARCSVSVTGRSTGVSTVTITLLNEYADNAAAAAAGLGSGDLYRTGDVVKIVH